jgi:hypothetical protein
MAADHALLATFNKLGLNQSCPTGRGGDAAAYANFRDRFREMAGTLGYEGHTAWAEAMP